MLLAPKRRWPWSPARIHPRTRIVPKPEGLFTFLVLRPLSDLFVWLWRLERRVEFLYRPWFDRRLRGLAARLGLSEATVKRHRRQLVDSVSTRTLHAA